MNLTEWYLNRAYSILDSTVPMSFDCGQLCGKKCCHGNEEDGMLLFPGEEVFFADDENFVIKESSLGKTLVCKGNCDRNRRPLACRIFPLFPYVVKNENGYRISVLKDVRALEYCPLDDGDILQSFKRSVRLAARSLLRDDECAEFLLNLTSVFTDIGKF